MSHIGRHLQTMRTSRMWWQLGMSFWCHHAGAEDVHPVQTSKKAPHSFHLAISLNVSSVFRKGNMAMQLQLCWRKIFTSTVLYGFTLSYANEALSYACHVARVAIAGKHHVLQPPRPAGPTQREPPCPQPLSPTWRRPPCSKTSPLGPKPLLGILGHPVQSRPRCHRLDGKT